MPRTLRVIAALTVHDGSPSIPSTRFPRGIAASGSSRRMLVIPASSYSLAQAAWIRQLLPGHLEDQVGQTLSRT